MALIVPSLGWGFPAEEPRLTYIFNHWGSFLRAEPILFS